MTFQSGTLLQTDSSRVEKAGKERFGLGQSSVEDTDNNFDRECHGHMTINSLD